MLMKVVASAAAVLLVSLAAVGAYAAQEDNDGSPAAANARDDGERGIPDSNPAFHDADGNCDEPHESETIENDDGTQQTLPCIALGGDDEANDDEDEEQSDDDADERSDDAREGPRGIPQDNPVFTDQSGDCDKHEAAIKVTPSGNEVRVPCHVVEKQAGRKSRSGD